MPVRGQKREKGSHFKICVDGGSTAKSQTSVAKKKYAGSLPDVTVIPTHGGEHAVYVAPRRATISEYAETYGLKIADLQKAADGRAR